MNYRTSIQELEKRGIMPESAPNLERMKAALQSIGFFDWPFWKKHKADLSRIVVVAGTNGKGSTCATLDTLLRAENQSVGFYSSPHLVHYTERIRVNGQPISEKLFVQAYEKIVKAVEQLPLTHFEVLTAMALWIFCSGEALPPVDRLILEVGLGGIWDATNAVPHGVAVITKLGLDHLNLLGPTLMDVARNKLGIVPDQGIVIHHPFPPETEKLVEETQNRTNCRWISSPKFSMEAQSGHPPRFHITTTWGHSELALAGQRGGENAVLALQVFEALGFSAEKNLGNLAKIKWPGRMELLHKTNRGTPVYFSGDHNPQGVQSCLDLLPFYPREKLHIICGIGKDKDRDGILHKLFSLPDVQIILTQTPFRGLNLEGYGPWITKAHGFFQNPLDAYDEAKEQATSSDMILITGSLYLMESLSQILP